MSRLKWLVLEVHRRSLWQVLLIYVGGAWACYELIDTISNRFALPDWLPALVVVLFLLGLPFVAATAFVREEVAPRVARTDVTPATEAEAAVARQAARRRRRSLTARNAGLSFMSALAVWGVVVTGWLVLGGGAGASATESKSVAVLPFANMSGDPANEYFADGITDDVITHLSKVADLKVTSRTSSMRYKGTQESVREIASELGVASILEGGVQRVADRIRINAQLIDAQTDEHLWAEQYDRALIDIFAIQSDIAQQIVTALEATLTGSEEEQIARWPTDNLEAYDLYVQARFLWNRRTAQDLQRAIGLFEEVIALDSLYAAAYAGLADTYATLYSWDLMPWEEAIPAAERALQRALELDPLLGPARATLANVLETQRDWVAADSEFVRALDLAPGYATAHHWYALMLAKLGRFEEALAEVRRAAELDPLSRIISTNIGWLHYLARDYDAAIEQLETVVAGEPTFAYPWALLGEAYAAAGRYPEAIAAMRRSVELEGWPNTQLRLAYIYERAGQSAEAARLLDEHRANGDPIFVALVFVAAGDSERAVESLDQALDQQSPFLNELKVEPRYDPIRSDPRFEELLRRLRLE
ncbi:MAG: tetratricopeptide repeat protein [Gemmatimonadota bacterium]|nr:MAG: tetratricopeptide repeat protein [Gemmatimonadota bacterium]